MKKAFILLIAIAMFGVGAYALTKVQGTDSEVSGKSAGTGLLSVLALPKTGHIVNNKVYDKNVTHAVLELTGVFRILSCYMAIVDNKALLLKNKI